MQQLNQHQQNAIYRKGRSPEFYINFVSEFSSSGLSIKKYCQLHHVAPNTFNFYKKEIETPNLKMRSPSLLKKPHRKNPPAPQMIELIPTPDPSAANPPSALSNVHTLQSQPTPSPFEIKFPNGIVLHLQYLDPTLLESLFTLTPFSN